MIQPPYLKRGDKIAILAPARRISFDEVHPAMKLFQKWGLEVILGSYVFNNENQFAGTDAQRMKDLQVMLDDASIRAIICARGGYGSVRIIDNLDFTKFIKHPKWIVGYSDITVLHSHIHRHFGIETLHATMPVNMPESQLHNRSVETFRKALFGEEIVYARRPGPLDRTGAGEGILAGGNLSILYSLMGSHSQIDTRGKILFLEDIDEYLYHIDRMMMNLKRAGMLKELKGLIVGSMQDMKDNIVPFGKTAQQIIFEAVKEYKYPVCFDFPAGHCPENVAMILGRRVKLIVDEEVELGF
ncbi:MAG: LD-carboxypeptidase [Bacteroidetes bacterium]|nr:LD-carboxypeptidase [Bacteroidota bacterium]